MEYDLLIQLLDPGSLQKWGDKMMNIKERQGKSGNVTWPCFLKAFSFLINEQKIYCSWINTLLWDCYILIPESLVTSINLNADEIDNALCFYYLSFLPPKTKFQSATMCCSFHVRTQQLILVAYQARGDCLFGCLTSYNAMFSEYKSSFPQV